MSLGQRATFTIADEATVSNGIHRPGYRLVGLILPTLDSTTIEFEASADGTTYVDVFTNSGTPAALTLGTASTGARVQAVPEDVGRISAVAYIRLVTAAQNGGPRSITGLWERIGA